MVEYFLEECIPQEGPHRAEDECEKRVEETELWADPNPHSPSHYIV